MKGKCLLIDTYEDFLNYWKASNSKDVDGQIALWQTQYMSKYPELLQKQIEDYQEMNVDWRETAKKVLQAIPQRFRLISEARENLLHVYEPVYSRAAEKLRLNFNVNFVIYVGIGCGAGWATTYHKRPAVLLGLENIAEEKWYRKDKLEGVIAHELGHLVHMKWRNEWETFGGCSEDPLFRLYVEGFAQRCEHLILEKKTWHMASNRGWLSWCEQHKTWLAGEFLKRIEENVSVNDFFGSWFDIQGKKQTGYFLGHAFVLDLEKAYSLKDVALLNFRKVRRLGLAYLKAIRTGVAA
jgi:hypothetical protein